MRLVFEHMQYIHRCFHNDAPTDTEPLVLPRSSRQALCDIARPRALSCHDDAALDESKRLQRFPLGDCACLCVRHPPDGGVDLVCHRRGACSYPISSRHLVRDQIRRITLRLCPPSPAHPPRIQRDEHHDIQENAEDEIEKRQEQQAHIVKRIRMQQVLHGQRYYEITQHQHAQRDFL